MVTRPYMLPQHIFYGTGVYQLISNQAYRLAHTIDSYCKMWSAYMHIDNQFPHSFSLTSILSKSTNRWNTWPFISPWTSHCKL